MHAFANKHGAMKRVFVGGTGRSGTTILQHALSFNRGLYAVPIETKFIVEVDGLAALADDMTTCFSPATTPEQIERFKFLMQQVLTGKVRSPYFTDTYGIYEFALPGLYSNYNDVVNRFINFISQNWETDREIYLSECRILIDGLFSTEASRRRISAWAEKSPANLVRRPFLRELYSDHYFVHMLRDPRDVFESYLDRGWLGHELEVAMKRMKALYKKWLSSIEYARQCPRFIEIRLEQFVHDTRSSLKSLAESLELPSFADDSIEIIQGTMKKYYASDPVGAEVLGPVDKPVLAPARPERLGRCNTDVATGVTS